MELYLALGADVNRGIIDGGVECASLTQDPLNFRIRNAFSRVAQANTIRVRGMLYELLR